MESEVIAELLRQGPLGLFCLIFLLGLIHVHKARDTDRKSWETERKELEETIADLRNDLLDERERRVDAARDAAQVARTSSQSTKESSALVLSMMKLLQQKTSDENE